MGVMEWATLYPVVGREILGLEFPVRILGMPSLG